MLSYMIHIILLLCLVIVSLTTCTLIKKVAIIGSGPAGLSLTSCLKRLNAGVSIVNVYESRESVLQTSLGGGVQLSSGSSILEKLGLLEILDKTAMRIKYVVGRDKQENVLLKLNVDDAVNLYSDNLLVAKDSGRPMVYAIMRDALQKLLYDSIFDNKVKSQCKVTFTTSKTCIKVEEYNDINNYPKVRLAFDDNSIADDFDLVVGTDGIKSVVKDYVLNDYKSSWIQNIEWIKNIYTSNRYSGIRITFVCSPVDKSLVIRNKNDINTFHQWFGNNCYSLTASYGGKSSILFPISYTTEYKSN